MKIKILNNLAFQVIPEEEGMTDFDEKDLAQIGKTKQFVDGKIVDYFNPQRRIEELKTLLKETDYQAIKYAEGEITHEDYLPIKLKRASYRAEINSLEEKIKNMA